MPQALVTGASGFLGSHLAEELASRGFGVKCLVRKKSRLEWLLDKGVEFVFGDIQDKASLKKILFDYDYIFHSAGVIKAGDPSVFAKVNYFGTRNLLEAAWENQLPLKRFVYISSLAAAGPSLNGRPKRETDLCNPTSSYGESKLAGERAVFEFSDRFPVTAIRPPAIYGPRDRQLLTIFKFSKFGIMPIIGDADSRFSLIHVKDLVEGIILAALSTLAVGQVYFLSDGRTYTWTEAGEILAGVQGRNFRRIVVPKGVLYILAALADFTAKLSGQSFYLTRRKIKELDYKMWVCDITKARTELGFSPRYDFRAGAGDTMDWYKKHNWL